MVKRSLIVFHSMRLVLLTSFLNGIILYMRVILDYFCDWNLVK